MTVEVADVRWTTDHAEDCEKAQVLMVELTFERAHLAVPVRSAHGFPRSQTHAWNVWWQIQQALAIDVQAFITIDMEEPLHLRERCQQTVDEPGVGHLVLVESRSIVIPISGTDSHGGDMFLVVLQRVHGLLELVGRALQEHEHVVHACGKIALDEPGDVGRGVLDGAHGADEPRVPVAGTVARTPRNHDALDDTSPGAAMLDKPASELTGTTW